VIDWDNVQVGEAHSDDIGNLRVSVVALPPDGERRDRALDELSDRRAELEYAAGEGGEKEAER